MVFGQIFKKRGGNNENTGDSTFETSEETEIPEIDGIMAQIDRNLNETRNIIVRKKERTMDDDGCSC